MEHINFQRVSAAIDFLYKNFKQQPSLEELAAHVHLSPFHFQRMFSEWAGVSPKKFLQYLNIEYSKKLLREEKLNLEQTAFETGLSGSSRLHDLFIGIEAMSPSEYQKGGANLKINYSYADSRFGRLLLASTSKGICHLAFADDEAMALNILQQHFPAANFQNQKDEFQQKAIDFFRMDFKEMKLSLHIKGTDFQLKVWESLLRIPMAKLKSYSDVAQNIEQVAASRAVGTAIGRNPVAFIIPCHRVIKSSGDIGSYMWGESRKKAIIAWEAAKMNK